MAVQGSDSFMISRGGTLYKALASEILSYVESQIGTSEFDVADITARNALSNLSVGDRVFVVDATADATVDSGWAIYVWRGAAWTKMAEQEGLDVVAGGTNLGYSAGTSNGVVASSTGTDATIPLADGTNAGLISAAEKTKVGHLTVTAATDLDAMRTASHAAVTLSGSASTNPLTLSGQTLGFSIANLTSAP